MADKRSKAALRRDVKYRTGQYRAAMDLAAERLGEIAVLQKRLAGEAKARSRTRFNLTDDRQAGPRGETAMTPYVRWALSQIPEGMKANPTAYRFALADYACEEVDGKVVQKRGKAAGLPLGCPEYLEACEEWDKERQMGSR